jgi:hypothetical protein
MLTKNTDCALFGVMSLLHQLLNFIKAFGALKFTAKYGAESTEICHSDFRYPSIKNIEAINNNKISNKYFHTRPHQKRIKMEGFAT